MQGLSTGDDRRHERYPDAAEQRAVGFFGVYYKLQNFLFMPLYGLTNTMVPDHWLQLGRQTARTVAAFCAALAFSTVIMLAGAVLFFAFPEALLRLFGDEAFAFSGGIHAIRIIAPSFLAAGIVTAFAGALQGLRAKLRRAAPDRPAAAYHPAACCFFCSDSTSIHTLWFAFPVAELGALPVSIILWRRAARLSQMPSQ